MSDNLEVIRRERGSVYGDPLWNHFGIGQAWVGLLAPCWRMIRDYVPLPPHVISLQLTAMKVNRTRLVYHKDNYDDLANYAGFANDWQARFDAGTLPMQIVWANHRLCESRSEADTVAPPSPDVMLEKYGVRIEYEPTSGEWLVLNPQGDTWVYGYGMTSYAAAAARVVIDALVEGKA